MRLGSSCGALFTLAAVVLFAAPAQAVRPVPKAGVLKGPTQRVLVGRLLQSAPPTCTLGVTGPASFPMFYLYPPEDQYYTLLDPAACACGEEAGLQLATAHVQLDFPEPCTIPVRVGVVAADLSDPACPVPIVDGYLNQPIVYDLSVTEAGQYDFSMALDGICISEKAFLLVTFVTGGDCGSWPGLMIDTAVCGCVAYNAWPGSGDITVDLCGVLPGSPVMYVDATCCSVVPTMGRSWGRIKTLYR
jgi:hypothetical protein